MTEATEKLAGLRAEILKDPSVILDDKELMRALMGEPGRGDGKVVDLRSVFVARLEARLDRLEDTHKSVIAAAYENLAGTNQVHRAVLALLAATDFEAFLHILRHDVANILGVDVIRLCLESDTAEGGDPIGPEGPLKASVVAVPPQGIAAYITDGRATAPRPVTLRPASEAKESIFGDDAEDIRAEALLKLNLGTDHLPGMLAFGSHDERRFSADQGTDLLTFFAQALERILRRWVA